MNLVSLEDVRKTHVDQLVLDGVTVGIGEGDRVGVIGMNGSGKSTLLRLVAGLDEPDAGRVVRSNRLDVSALMQEPVLDLSGTALQAVLAGESAVARTARSFEEATAALRRSPTDTRAQERVEQATRAMDAAGAWGLERTARALLDRLGVAEADGEVATLSGGQRKRVALAKALAHAEAAATVGEQVSLLVLDEPTNHLDVEVVEWLEALLMSRGGALLFVTHDRYLLDRVATRVVEVEQAGLRTYHGSYSAYLEDRERRREMDAAISQRHASRARTELAWLRRNPSARTTKSRARVERAHTLLDTPETRAPVELRLDLPARRLGSKVVNLHGVGKRYGDRRVLRGVDHKLAPGERLGVVGPNGSGKTTLLRLIAGRIEPDEGSVRIGQTTVIGWYGQDPHPLPPDLRLLDAVTEIVLETNTIEGVRLSAAQLLERFLFAASRHKALVGELSGGERRRLELLRVLATAPNLLLLDEPTNDLDLDTLAVLEDYLDSWPGALVVASHDRFFLDRVCGHLFSIETDGSVRDHPGGWSAYRAALEATPEPLVAGADPIARRPAGARRRKLTFGERRELGSMEGRIADLEGRKSALSEALSGADYAAAQDLSAQLAAVLAELDQAESRWLELAAIDEEAS
ncbi:MAG: ABC-F family ATP-binding cassette domain-containing protein [Egibacteraceae bacterium]